MSKQLRIWLFVLIGTLLATSSLLAEGVITMTTSKAVGETIALDIKANGNITIEGAQETGRKDYYGEELYRLSSQTITIRGDVTYLDCDYSRLTSLDVSGCTALTSLSCTSNQLTSLDVSGCTALTKLDCSDNPLTSIDLSNCKSLKEFTWDKKELTSLDVSGCTALTELNCYENQLTSLNVSGCTSLTKLNCYGNQLTSLDVSDCTSLTTLNCNHNQLTSLNVSGCTTLTTLSCYGNPLTSINLSNCTLLKKFTWNEGKLTSLDVSGCTSLTELHCSDNQLTSLDVTGCTSLTKLNSSDNQLTSLDVSKNTDLTELDCYGNQINGENMTKLVNSLPSRKGLRSGNLVIVSRRESEVNLCRQSDIAIAQEKNWIPKWQNGDSYKGIGDGVIIMTTSKAVGEKVELKIKANGDVLIEGVSEMPYLSERYSENYTLTSQTITIQGDVTEFDCYGNQLTSLDVTSCTSLTKLNSSDNQLTSLDMTSCASLTKLNSSDNQLTSLDVSKNTALTELDCSGNQINGEGMTKLVNSLPDRKGMSSGALRVVEYSSEKKDQNWCSFADVATASKKNWAVQKHEPYYSWTSYSGVGEGVITMTTSKAVGEKVDLGIVANGDVVIEGVSEMPQVGRYRNDYRLTSQTITIRGDVTELDCYDNQLTSLNVSKNTALTKLSCYDNQLTSLNVSGCTALTELDCSKNQLTSLNVTGCTSLTKLVCYKNHLKGEAMTQMVDGLSNRNGKEAGALYVVCDEADENNLLRSDVLTVSRKNWRVFKYIVNAGKSVLYSGAGGDDEIVMTITQEQYLAGGIRLAILADGDVTIEGVHEKRIFTDGSEHTYTLAGTQITIRGNVSELDCSKNQITNLDLSKCNSLWTLSCSGNKLTNVDVSRCSLLTYLACQDNKLTSLNVSGCTALTELYCGGNQLTGLNVSKNTALTELGCSYNQLTSLDVSGCTALTTLSCHSNQINGENMTRLVNSLPDRKGLSKGTLRVVDANRDKNWCSFADVATASKKNWAVQKYEPDYSWTSYSGVGEGVITMTTSKAVGEKVDLGIVANGDVVIEGVSEMPQLGRNRNYTLTSQTIIIRGDVAELDCDNNQLTSLDLLQNRALVELDCSRNNLETLDLSACTRLESLTCYRNKIRGNAVAQLVESLPDRYGKNPGKFYFVYYSNDEYEENFCYRPAVGRANDKNWRPQKRYYSGWKDYFGVIDEGVVMMRTAQEVGSKITLTLEAKGDVAIDGVKGVPETDGKPHQYTLLSQDVTIRGYVTKLHCSGNMLTSLDLSTTVPLVELDCSNNQLTSLDVSHNAAVTSLACYRNQIKGEAMAQLIKGLPQLPLRSTHLFGIVSNAADEGNVFLKADVERVRDKGWSPMKWDEERQQYEPYAGKETETFAVTLTKEGEGTITATGADDLTAVPYGTELTIVATPTEGYELISLTAGEEDILATKKVVVTDNVTVKATFDEATFAVSLKKEGEGTISATGASDLNAVAYGTELTINATPAMGYELTALTANGTDILTTKKVVIKGATEVKATFVDHTGVETTVTQETQLFPNPATDYVIVEDVAPASEVTLHSMTGERLYAGRADSRGTLQIDLTPYADGVYLVCVAGETYRVVVRH